MIFTTWNFGPEKVVPLTVNTKIFVSFSQADQGREAARQYAADIFGWCAVKRDYSYADHPMPTIPWPLHWCAAMEIQQNCIREFNRSNPGHEINPN